MVRTALLFLVIINISNNSIAQSVNATDRLEVQNAVSKLFEAIFELDVNKVKSLCTPNVRILENGSIWNLDSLALRISFRKSIPTDFKRINKMEFIETNVLGEVGRTTYFIYATITYNKYITNVKWLESAVLNKTNMGWKISMLHSTELFRNH